MSERAPLTEADRHAYRAAQLREIFDQCQPLTPKEYIGIELCRRGFANAATGQHTPPPVALAYDVIVEPDMIGPRRMGSLQREETGQLFLELFPPQTIKPESKTQ